MEWHGMGWKECIYLSIQGRTKKRNDCAGHRHHYGHGKMSPSVSVHAMQKKYPTVVSYSLTHASDLCITSTLPTLRLIYIYIYEMEDSMHASIDQRQGDAAHGLPPPMLTWLGVLS